MLRGSNPSTPISSDQEESNQTVRGKLKNDFYRIARRVYNELDLLGLQFIALWLEKINRTL
jgi:hypothetical protein